MMRDEALEVALVEHPESERHLVDRGGRPHGQPTPFRGQFGQRGPAVGGMGDPPDQALLLEPVDDVGDAGGVDHEPLPHLAERQRSPPGEQQEHQTFVAGKGEPKGPQGAVDGSQHDLLGTHDGRGGGHVVAGVGAPPSLPL